MRHGAKIYKIYQDLLHDSPCIRIIYGIVVFFFEKLRFEVPAGLGEDEGIFRDQNNYVHYIYNICPLCLLFNKFLDISAIKSCDFIWMKMIRLWFQRCFIKIIKLYENGRSTNFEVEAISKHYWVLTFQPWKDGTRYSSVLYRLLIHFPPIHEWYDRRNSADFSTYLGRYLADYWSKYRRTKYDVFMKFSAILSIHKDFYMKFHIFCLLFKRNLCCKSFVTRTVSIVFEPLGGRFKFYREFYKKTSFLSFLWELFGEILFWNRKNSHLPSV